MFTVIHKLKCRRSMIRFRKRAKSIRFILNQTTRILKDRASLLKSRRRRQGHMIWLPFLPGFLLWKLAIGSLFPLLVRKYPI
jgi:hypothetical protein